MTLVDRDVYGFTKNKSYRTTVCLDYELLARRMML